MCCGESQCEGSCSKGTQTTLPQWVRVMQHTSADLAKTVMVMLNRRTPLINKSCNPQWCGSTDRITHAQPTWLVVARGYTGQGPAVGPK